MEKDVMNFRASLFEKIFIFFHTPYLAGALLVAFFVGPLGNFLYFYALSFDITDAFYMTFFSKNLEEIGFASALSSNWYSLVGNLIWYIFLFYVAFIISYLRKRLIEAEPELVELAPNGKEDIRGISIIVSMVLPQLIITFIFLLVYATSVPDMLGKGELTVLTTPVFVVRSLLRSIMFGSVLWLYGGSLYGLYKFGKLNLKLKSYYEDLMLGTRELGSVSFSFSATYFLGLTLFAVQMILGGLAGQNSLVNLISILILIPMGIILFLAPLISTHHRMIESKRIKKASVNKQFSELFQLMKETDEKDNRYLARLLMLQTMEQKVQSIKAWPIDSSLIDRLALIATSVTTLLIVQALLTFVKI